MQFIPSGGDRKTPMGALDRCWPVRPLASCKSFIISWHRLPTNNLAGCPDYNYRAIFADIDVNILLHLNIHMTLCRKGILL